MKGPEGVHFPTPGSCSTTRIASSRSGVRFAGKNSRNVFNSLFSRMLARPSRNPDSE
ncbi:hypothetical protein ACFL1R_08000 [Candidatus Latescibacterota bacterium]